MRVAAAQQVDFWRKRGTPIGAVEVLQMLLHQCERADVDQIRPIQQRTWVIDENGASFSLMLKYIPKQHIFRFKQIKIHFKLMKTAVGGVNCITTHFLIVLNTYIDMRHRVISKFKYFVALNSIAKPSQTHPLSYILAWHCISLGHWLKCIHTHSKTHRQPWRLSDGLALSE